MNPFCHTPDCDNPVENRDTGLCSSCSRKSRKEEELALAEPKKRKPIKKASPKRAIELKEYAVVRDEFLAEHNKCEVAFCMKKSQDVHHSAGRSGKMLLNTEYFLAVCREHHDYIELNPDWSKANGYSLDRLTVNQ